MQRGRHTPRVQTVHFIFRIGFIQTCNIQIGTQRDSGVARWSKNAPYLSQDVPLPHGGVVGQIFAKEMMLLQFGPNRGALCL